jgi:hypothetical protein
MLRFMAALEIEGCAVKTSKIERQRPAGKRPTYPHLTAKLWRYKTVSTCTQALLRQRKEIIPQPKLKGNAQNFFKTIFFGFIPFRQVKIRNLSL